MKAIEILKEIRNRENDYDHLKTHRFDDAIKELEDDNTNLTLLISANKSMSKIIMKMNEEMIKLRIENQELKERIKDDI